MTTPAPLRDVQHIATRAADAGFDGLVVTEAGRTAYLACAAAALSGADLDITTGVAVAFPRSPMVTASVAWELAEATGGRFRLGIGPQVKAHVERRYSAPFDPPGPRMKEYVLAVKAAFKAFRGEGKLDFAGEHYRLSLLPPMWSPGPIGVPDPPVDVAAVNPWMLRMTGEVADGVHVHPINTPTYIDQTLLPNLLEGARSADRDPRELTAYVPVFTVVGENEKERATWRETCRTMVGFYGTTPNYEFIFDQLGYEGTTEHLRTAQKAGDQVGMRAAIPDELLEHFVVEGTWEDVVPRIAERCRPIEEAGPEPHVVLYLAGMTAQQPGDTFERFGALARSLRG